MNVPEQATENLKKLPEWVKCVYCGKPPTMTDWCGELIKGSNALAHQSCAREHGKMFGMNAGTMQELGNKIKSVEGE